MSETSSFNQYTTNLVPLDVLNDKSTSPSIREGFLLLHSIYIANYTYYSINIATLFVFSLRPDDNIFNPITISEATITIVAD